MDNGIINIDSYNYSDWNEITLGDSQYLLKSNKLSQTYNNIHDGDSLVIMNDLTNNRHDNIKPGDVLENNNLVWGVVKLIERHSDNLKYILLCKNDYYSKVTNDSELIKERVPTYNTLIDGIFNIA